MSTPRPKPFFNLTLTQQIKTLYEEGTFITAIRYYKYKINLYQLENQLIEVFFNHKLDLIEKVVPLSKNTTRLKFYSDQIKLPLNFSA